MNETAQTMVLEDYLKRLKLPAMLRDWEECARQARQSQESYPVFLLDLATRELEQRQANQLKRRLKEARFPVMKTLETTELEKWPGIDGLEVKELTRCDWIAQKDNVVLIGKHGTGKTHAATVIGVEACRSGYRTLFTTAAQLANRLLEARQEKELERLLKRLDRFALLIVDELGYIPFSQEGSQLLFQVFANRYERSSTLVTSNLAFAEWTRVFADASLTAALLDRLTHHCQIHSFDWESIRLKDSLKRRNKKTQKAAVAATAPPKGAHKESDQVGAPNPT
jgi:DNA replication protein DnaC